MFLVEVEAFKKEGTGLCKICTGTIMFSSWDLLCFTSAETAKKRSQGITPVSH